VTPLGVEQNPAVTSRHLHPLGWRSQKAQCFCLDGRGETWSTV